MKNSVVGKGMAHLIRTHALHRKEIVKRELIARNERIDPLQGGLEVPKLAKTSGVNWAEIEAHAHVLACPFGDKPRGTSASLRSIGIRTTASGVSAGRFTSHPQ